MKNVALFSQPEIVIEGDITTAGVTIIQMCSDGETAGDEIAITKPCIRAFIKELTRVADAVGA